MLETLRNAFKIEDIRKRIGYTFLMLIVIRIGSQLPIPCVNSEVFANWFANQGGDAFSFLDAITGGSFYQMSVFALNITPYITSSINCNSEAGRTSERWRRGKKEDYKDNPLLKCDPCISRSDRNGNWFRKKRISG